MGIKQAFKALVQGSTVVEGGRDILTPSVTQASTAAGVIDKNNYKTYSGMVKTAYEMYNGRTDYGSEMFGSIVDTRLAFIAGEGVSVNAKKKTTQKYIDKFLTLNKLHGSVLLDMVRTSELEGKDLVVLSKAVKKETTEEINYIKAQNIQWWTNPYNVEVNPKNTDEVKKIKLNPKKEESKEIDIPEKMSVYVKIGGTDDRINETAGKVHRCMTQIENFSRAHYDLRKNMHLFGKIMPYWKTERLAEAKAIQDDVNSGNWTVGQGYAGTADFSMVGPPLGAYESIKGELLLLLKIISTNSGIPVHWMAWPELMSNRATAENLLEVINAATRKERLIWEEKLKEMINKSMVMAIDAGFEDNSIIGEYHLELPLISMANLKSIMETWIPLQQLDVISMGTVRSKIPTINPSEEAKMIDKEKMENVERFQNAGGKDIDDMRSGLSKDLNGEGNEDTGEDTSES